MPFSEIPKGFTKTGGIESRTPDIDSTRATSAFLAGSIAFGSVFGPASTAGAQEGAHISEPAVEQPLARQAGEPKSDLPEHIPTAQPATPNAVEFQEPAPAPQAAPTAPAQERSAAPDPVEASDDSVESSAYIVEEGDTAWSIATKAASTMGKWETISALEDQNPDFDPLLIHPGDEIRGLHVVGEDDQGIADVVRQSDDGSMDEGEVMDKAMAIADAEDMPTDEDDNPIIRPGDVIVVAPSPEAPIAEAVEEAPAPEPVEESAPQVEASTPEAPEPVAEVEPSAPAPAAETLEAVEPAPDPEPTPQPPAAEKPAAPVAEQPAPDNTFASSHYSFEEAINTPGCYDYTQAGCIPHIEAVTDFLISNMNLSTEGFEQSLANRNMDFADEYGPTTPIDVEAIVLHWTGASGYSGVESFLGAIGGNPACGSAGCSVHFFMDSDANTYQLTQDLSQKLLHVRGHNSRTVGIEIEAASFDEYTPAQMEEAVYVVLQTLYELGLPINRDTVTSHSELTPGKIDPPPSFVDEFVLKLEELDAKLQSAEEVAEQSASTEGPQVENISNVDPEVFNGVDPQLVQEAVEYLVLNHGFSYEGAGYFVGGLIQESSMNPCEDRGDDGAAEGLAQWHPDRRSEDFPSCDRHTATDQQRKDTFFAQLGYAAEEMQNDNYFQAKVHDIYTTPGLSTEEYREAGSTYEGYSIEGRRIEYGTAIVKVMGFDNH